MDTPDDLERLISSPRFSSYLDEAGGDRVRAVVLYHWTGDVAGALLTDYRHLEVAFRNAVDGALQRHVEKRPGWPEGRAWFDDGSWVRHRWLDRQAERELGRARQRATRGRRAPSRGSVIAELPFGFWRYIVAVRYEQSFWVPVLDKAFHNIPAHRPDDRRRELEDRLIPLNKLRNRIAHHEPIFRPFVRQVRGGVEQSLVLDEHYRYLLDVLGWIDRPYARWVEDRSRVPGLLAARP